MTWPVILLDGPLRNQTLSGIRFDKYGTRTNQEIYICNTWQEGFLWAKVNNYKQALFVKSGTLFIDWHQWKKLVDSYPHYGLIAHLIWPPNQRVFLDDQCWFINLEDFDMDDLEITTISQPLPVRSMQNIHDDYTPLWIKPGEKQEHFQPTKFGQGLIAKQMKHNKSVVNWNQVSRAIKVFLYDSNIDLSCFEEYKKVAENQLWLLNNEPVQTLKKTKIVCPGSGLFWILNVIDPATTHINVVDISKIQIMFCQELWSSWNGLDYGSFSWNFIQQNKLVHYELDYPDASPLQRLQLKNKTKFISHVNTKFEQLAGENFQHRWKMAQDTKTITFENENLVTWVLQNDRNTYDAIWCSNILDYKWTLLHTSVQQHDQFLEKIK